MIFLEMSGAVWDVLCYHMEGGAHKKILVSEQSGTHEEPWQVNTQIRYDRLHNS